ncbi:MAG: hypothetical protein GXX94_01260 [Chloroflexi bacterium]|nr:hypothetical protein [Chloroflexota bacterium]
MPHALVVANPLAGNARIAQIRRMLAAQLGPPWTYRLVCLSPGLDLHALIRREVEAGADVIVAAGGDGTVRSVAGCLVGASVPLAILPEGTANVLARDTGIPARMEAALALIKGQHDLMRLDAIEAAGSFAFMNLSIGLSAGIIRDTDSAGKRRYGMLAYIWSGAKNLLAVGTHDVTLTVDGSAYRLRASEVLVANCPTLGAKELRVPVDIQPADGTLQVIAFRARHLVDYVHVARELLLRRPRTLRHIQVFQASRQVSIEATEVLDVQADGDLIGRTPLEARLVPGAVSLVVPVGQSQGQSIAAGRTADH